MRAKPYPKYKASGVEWLGEVPEGWEAKRFSREVYIQEGQVDPETEPFLSMFLIGPEHIESGTGRVINKLTAQEQSASSGKYFCRGGNVLYSKIRPALCKVAIAEEDCICSADMYPLRSKKGCDHRFLFWYLLSDRFTAWSVLEADRVAMPKINRKTLNSAQIPVPPLPEQQSIATFLDRETGRIDALIARKQRLIELLKEKRTALISRAVTKGLDPKVKMKPSGVEWLGEVPEHWEAVPLRRAIRSVKTGGTPTGAEDSAFDDEGFNWYSPGDFSETLVLGKSNRSLSEEGKNGARVFPPMTVMLVGIGATIGKVGLSSNESSCNQQINGLVCGPLLDPVFTAYYMKTMRDFIVKCGKFTTLPIINQEETKNLVITVPPLPEQHLIASFLDRETAKLDALTSKVTTVIDKLKEYRTALISAAVTGKIDVGGAS